jgi:hypothetical protein
MFYCEECRKRNGYPEAFLNYTRGPCEICGKVAVCHDVHHSKLPARYHFIDGKPLAAAQEPS